MAMPQKMLVSFGIYCLKTGILFYEYGLYVALRWGS